MREPLTVSQIARLFDVSEARVRKMLRDCDAKAVGTARFGAALYDPDTIDMIGRRFLLGVHGARVREVIVLDELVDEGIALAAAGLHVEHAANVLHATGLHEADGMPIIVVPAGLPDTEMNLLRSIHEHVYLVTVGDADEWSARVGAVVEKDSLRRLVQVAWRLVGIRTEQAKINI